MNYFLTKAVSVLVASAAIPHQEGPALVQQASSKNTFNPQISLVTDFRWKAVESDPTVIKEASFKEAELGLAADVDPFLRGEAYISFTEENGTAKAEVEEAYGRYDRLGHGLSAKFGKIAAGIGRVQRNHGDQLNWLDYPFMVQDFLGDEGLRAGGASMSYLLPGNHFSELTFEALDSHGKGMFAGGTSGSPLFVTAYRTFFDFSEDSSAQVGLSYSNGPSPMTDKRSSLVAAEFTYKWQPGTPGRSLNFETEGYWGNQGGSPGTKFGGFAALTYELRPRLLGYVKADYSEMPGGTNIRKALTLGTTLRVTEFHHWRIEYQRIISNFASSRNVVNIQLQWLIGSHPAHKY